MSAHNESSGPAVMPVVESAPMPVSASTPIAVKPAAALLNEYAVILAGLLIGLTLLIVILLSNQPAGVLLQVVPAVLVTLAASGGTGLRLLRKKHVSAPQMILVPAIAAFAVMYVSLLLLAVAQGRPLGRFFARHIVEKGLLGAPLLGAIVGASLLLLHRTWQREFAAWQRESAQRLRGEQLQRERALADLQLLQAQIEPHFLYNTLANLRQLIRADSARALAMLEHLIRYFKLVLPAFRCDSLPLGDEVALAQTYLELLRERLGRPIRFDIDVPGDLLDAKVLPGALLCLVENAVKHGLPVDDSAAILHLAVRRDGNVLRMSLWDNGSGLRAMSSANSTGTGLRNLRERLMLVYGGGAGVYVRDTGHGCEATVEMPTLEATAHWKDGTSA